ncbi:MULTISPECIES: DUF1990 domain-containing protein [unclassified Streptomyces]|uniref:DUF1990 family protein n=1 Tax=unclassified Streptomyces TaxID=2593676 RepID=UPI000DBAA82C|nr:DUF1990 domain-containing protein [Streptomyces sp. PsTaAH-137]MYT73224.1 DUF1990 family protein [Streptomyces sp. SID8367]RAJ74823.1 uncharacterized protein (UPF0548 family) [Streptomyces sp. PsTaAH-137]
MNLTYEEVGATLTDGHLPSGYAHMDRRVRLGSGSECFERAGAAVLSWAAHRGAGFTVTPDGPAQEGVDVVVSAPLLRIPCRVVRVVRSADRIGFAYGTLRGHPECGEEAFVVELDADGSVWFRVRAFSRPGRWFVRVGGPVARGVQLWVTRRYLRAVVRACADAP